MDQVIAELSNLVLENEWDAEQRIVSLAFDSMKVRGSCVYSSVTGEFIGLVEREEEHIIRIEFEAWVEAPSNPQLPLARDYFVWYVTSLGLNENNHFILPIARWASTSAHAWDIASMCTAVMTKLSAALFKAAFVSCDGASENSHCPRSAL